MSPEWDEFHDHARQSIESLHSGFKDDGKDVIASSERRRVRGSAGGQTLVTIMLINFNLRPIAKFLRDEVASRTTPIRKAPRATRSSTSQPAANSNHRFEPEQRRSSNTAKRHPPPQTEESTAPKTGRVRHLTDYFAERRPPSPFWSHVRARKEETLPTFLRSTSLSGSS